jgi:hypothetical protein
MIYVKWVRSAAGNVRYQAGNVEALSESAARAAIWSGWAVRCDSAGGPVPCTAEWERCREAKTYDVPTPHCCVGHVSQIFADLKTVFEKHKVTWWIDYGSILGAVRNGAQIPHDKDGDGGILEDERLQVEMAMDDMDELGYYVIRKKRREGKYAAGNSIKVCLSERNRTNVDLFFWHRDGDVWTRHNWCSVDKYKGRDVPHDKLFPLIQIPYEKMTLPAPADPEWMCEHRYGKDWRVPIKRNNDGVRR